MTQAVVAALVVLALAAVAQTSTRHDNHGHRTGEAR